MRHRKAEDFLSSDEQANLPELLEQQVSLENKVKKPKKKPASSSEVEKAAEKKTLQKLKRRQNKKLRKERLHVQSSLPSSPRRRKLPRTMSRVSPSALSSTGRPAQLTVQPERLQRRLGRLKSRRRRLAELH